MLRLKDVVAHYGAIEVLHGISIDVTSGALVALLGANGAGKTTTLKTIAGLLPIRSGAIEFQERPLDKLAPHAIVRRGVAMVSQGRDLFPDMTIAENLALGALMLRPQQDKDAVMEEQLARFPRLRERYGQRAGTLSGGERAMLAVARALMSRPSLLLLDEPTSGLAPIIVSELGRTLKELNAAGQTILLVEQNVHMALGIAEHVYAMRNGSIVMDAPASAVSEEELSRSYLT